MTKEEYEHEIQAAVVWIKTLLAENLRVAQTWQPIETAPITTRDKYWKESPRILVANREEVATAEFTNGRWILSPTAWEGGGDRGGLADLPFEPTHWMPLLEPPK